MAHDLTTFEGTDDTPTASLKRDQVARLADEVIRNTVFARYQQTKARQTLRRQRADLALFVTFLTHLEDPAGNHRKACGLSTPLFLAHATLHWLQVAALMSDPHAWEGISYGLVELYKQWQLHLGYTIGSVNVRVSTVRKYAQLAKDAGVLSQVEYACIKDMVKTITRKEGLHIDEAREVTRVGDKKAAPVQLTTAQVERLINEHPDTAQGARDAFLMVLLFRYGLRCGEVAGLTLTDYKRASGKLTFFREKTAGSTTLQLEPEDMQRAERYYQRCQPENEAINPTSCIIMGSNNRGRVYGTMGERSITGRANTLGKRILLIENISGHDGRHHGASEYAAGGTDAKTLMEIFNWTNAQTALNYVNAAQVANQNARRGKVE